MIEWNVLNIEETTDEELITQAYRRMLTVTNPEDNPAGFMLLRNTYEQAMAYAKNAKFSNNSMMNNPGGYSPADAMFNMSLQPMMNTNDVQQPKSDNKVDLDKTVVIDNISDIIRKNLNKGGGVPFATRDNIEKPSANDMFASSGMQNQSSAAQNQGSGMQGQGFGMLSQPMNDNKSVGMQSADNIGDMNNPHASGHMMGSNDSNSRVYASQQSYTLNEGTVDEQKLLQQWIKKVEAIYYDFGSRISEDMWKEVLSVPVCVELDTRQAASEALLRFLMKHYYLPQNIWQLIDRTFDYTGSKNELLERYPREFIEDVVLSSINYPDIINYYMFMTDLHLDTVLY